MREVGAILVVFFDLGQTLVGGDPAMMFARYLRERGRFGDAAWERLGAALVVYRAGTDPDGAVEAANAAFASAFAGLRPSELGEMARAAVPAVLAPAYFAYSRPLVAAFRSWGYRSVAVTGVADPLASLVSSDLGIDETCATALETRSGRLTGAASFESTPLWKADRAAARLRESARDLDSAFAFGDSAADVPLLERVGRPVVVNPREAFAAAIADRGWPILTGAGDVLDAVAALRARPAWNEPVGRVASAPAAGAETDDAARRAPSA